MLDPSVFGTRDCPIAPKFATELPAQRRPVFGQVAFPLTKMGVDTQALEHCWKAMFGVDVRNRLA